MNPYAFVVSLPRETKRRKLMEAQLECIEMPYEIFDAVYGKDIPDDELAKLYDEQATLNTFGRGMTRGEIGCALSHHGIYRQIVERDLPGALILEDDALLGRDLPAVLKSITLDPDVPRVILLTHVQKHSRVGRQKIAAGRYLAGTVNAYCTHGYLISRAAAKILAQELMPIRQMADCWELIGRVQKVPVDCVVPYCIGQAPLALQSAIEETRKVTEDAYKKPLMQRVRSYIYRKFFYQIFTKQIRRIKSQESTW